MKKLFSLNDATLMNIHCDTGMGFSIEIGSEHFGLITIAIGFPELFFQRKRTFSAEDKPAGLFISRRTELIDTMNELSYELLQLDRCFHMSISLKDSLIDIVSISPLAIRSTKNISEMSRISSELNDYLNQKYHLFEKSQHSDDFSSSYAKTVASYDDVKMIHPMNGRFIFPFDSEILDVNDDGIHMCVITGEEKRYESLDITSYQAILFIEELTCTGYFGHLFKDYPNIGPIYTASLNEEKTNVLEGMKHKDHLRIHDSDYVIDIC